MGTTIALPDAYFQRALDMFKFAMQLRDRPALITLSGGSFMSESLVFPPPMAIQEFIGGKPLFADEVEMSLLSISSAGSNV